MNTEQANGIFLSAPKKTRMFQLMAWSKEYSNDCCAMLMTFIISVRSQIRRLAAATHRTYLLWQWKCVRHAADNHMGKSQGNNHQLNIIPTISAYRDLLYVKTGRSGRRHNECIYRWYKPSVARLCAYAFQLGLHVWRVIITKRKCNNSCEMFVCQKRLRMSSDNLLWWMELATLLGAWRAACGST